MQRNKRLRVFAGPNGSGKSTLFEEFRKNYDPGYFINADELEKKLATSGLIDLSEIGIKTSQKDLEEFTRTKGAKSMIAKSSQEGHIINIEIKENFIVDISRDTHSYEASFSAAFIRWLLYKNNKSFSFETVMSHPSKIDEIKKAKQLGYKTYLYFVCTEDPQINVKRVANRENKGGHKVAVSKIKSRYIPSLKNLYAMVQVCDRAFFFDNSSKQLRLIAETFNGILKVKVSSVPAWFVEYVLVYYN